MIRDALEDDPLVSGMEVDAPQWSRLEALLELWRRYARAMNLTGATTDEALVDHVHDGLATVACARRASGLKDPGPWIDVGSGGGFPGLVVAAVVEAPLVLVEPRTKRAAFLELAVRAVGRADVVVWRGRLERATWNEKVVNGDIGREKWPYAVASARAVWGPAEWLEMGINLVRKGGHVLVHVAEGSETGIREVPEHTEQSRKGRVLGFSATTARMERFTWFPH